LGIIARFKTFSPSVLLELERREEGMPPVGDFSFWPSIEDMNPIRVCFSSRIRETWE
jgi:hypothetical protein